MDAAKNIEGDFGKLVKSRAFGTPIPHGAAYQQLLAGIAADRDFSTIGRRAVLWVIQTSRLSEPVLASFPHRVWGRNIGYEIQGTADMVGQKYRPLFLECGTGLHISHHDGGIDDIGNWNPAFPANTVWACVGEDYYPKPTGPRAIDRLTVIIPTLAEISSIRVEPDMTGK